MRIKSCTRTSGSGMVSEGMTVALVCAACAWPERSGAEVDILEIKEQVMLAGMFLTDRLFERGKMFIALKVSFAAAAAAAAAITRTSESTNNLMSGLGRTRV